MRQVSLKIRSYGAILSIIDNSDIEKRALRFILTSFGVLAFFYVIILGNMVFNIIERKSMEAESRTLATLVVDLELSYLKLSEKVDESMAERMGFKEVEASFAARKSLGSVKFANNGF